MGNLFNRVAFLTIGTPGKTFQYPPFSIEFEQKFGTKCKSETVIKLFNPNDATIEAVKPIFIGKTARRPNVILSAGYADDYGVCCVGEAYHYEIKKEKSDVVLTMKVSEAVSIFRNAKINMTFMNQTASSIVTQMCNAVGILMSKVMLGTDILYDQFTVTDFYSALDCICEDTESDYYFNNGIFVIQPELPLDKKEIFVLTPRNGLLNIPEPVIINGNQNGIKFQTLFFYRMFIGDIVQIFSKKYEGVLVRLTLGKKKFSTYANCESEWEAVLI